MLSAVERAIAARPAGVRLVLLCDFDGTLADLDPDPQKPVLTPGRRALLEMLAGRDDMSVGLVSGRRIADLRSRTGLPPVVYYAGLHGLEIEVDGRQWRHPDLDRHWDRIRDLVERFEALGRETPGVIIEDKDVSVAVHVRAAAADRRDEVLARARRLAAPMLADGDIALLGGSFVLEFLPDLAWHKGDATRWIVDDVAQRHAARPWTVFVGDDVTDENAFLAIEQGIGVLVGDRRTAAGHRVGSPAEVEQLLGWLAALPVVPGEDT